MTELSLIVASYTHARGDCDVVASDLRARTYPFVRRRVSRVLTVDADHACCEETSAMRRRAVTCFSVQIMRKTDHSAGEIESMVTTMTSVDEYGQRNT